MRRAVFVAALAGSVLACQPRLVELVLPPLESTRRSVLFAVQQPAGSANVDVWASAVAHGALSHPVVLLKSEESEVDARIFAFVYDESFVELGVEEEG